MIRYYKYIGMLEHEIRSLLGIGDESMAFARESRHYWQERPRSLWIVRYSYMIIVGAVLAYLYWLRLEFDMEALGKGNIRPLVVDVAIGLPTLVVYLSFVAHSFGHDRRTKFEK